jgi:FkbM family methyltransferase
VNQRFKNLLLAVTGGWSAISVGTLAYAVWVATPDTPPATGSPAATTVPGRTPREGPDPELAAMVYRYFPVRLSQGWEEMFIRDYFDDRRGGFFVDVGASHYRTRSTTHYLDVALGWTGIAIDALPEYAEEYARFRPRTKYLAFFVSDTPDHDVDFFLVKGNPRLSTGHKATADGYGREYETRKVRTVTLDKLLDAHGVQQIDLLKMDIEMWEPQALRGFTIERFKPRLVVIEEHPPVREALRRYFADHGYVVIDTYTSRDALNAYYVPREDLPAFLTRPTSGGAPAGQIEPAATRRTD